MSGSGYIHAFRTLDNHASLENLITFRLFMRCCLRAAHKPIRINWRGQTISLNRGQLALSIRAFAREFDLSYKAVRIAQQRLEADDMIVAHSIISGEKRGAVGAQKWGAERGAVGLLITVCNYDTYQPDFEDRGAERGALAIGGGAHSGRIEQYTKTQDLKTKLRVGGAIAPAPNGASPPQHFQKGDSKTTNHPLPDARNWTPKSWAELKARELLCDNDASYRRVLDEFREYEGGRGRLMKDWSFVFLGFVRKDAKWAADRADERERFAQTRARMALDKTGNNR